MPPNTATLRILDASIHRASEGLRVVEDYVRFVLDDGHLTRLVKQLRHDLAQICAALPLPERHAARDTEGDVGTEITTSSESERADAWDVCLASLERVKQSLRSLEEYGKLVDARFAERIESTRYQLYTLERSLGITEASRSRLRATNLCALIDARESESAFAALVNELLAAGVGMIQLRDKSLSDARLVDRAKMLKETIGPANCLAILNDRPDIAAVAHFDGVHLGQDDMSVRHARTIVGPQKLIGMSTHTIEQARQAVLDGANYLGAGPTYRSKTKSFAEFPGLELLKQLANEIRLPTFAIGGIDAQNLSQVLATGTTRIAVSSPLLHATDPGEAAQQLLRQLPNALLPPQV